MVVEAMVGVMSREAVGTVVVVVVGGIKVEGEVEEGGTRLINATEPSSRCARKREVYYLREEPLDGWV